MKKSCCKRTHKTTTVQFVQLEKVPRHPTPEIVCCTHTYTYTYNLNLLCTFESFWITCRKQQHSWTQILNDIWYQNCYHLSCSNLWLLVLLVAVILVVSIGVLFLSELLCWSVWWFFWCFLCKDSQRLLECFVFLCTHPWHLLNCFLFFYFSFAHILDISLSVFCF